MENSVVGARRAKRIVTRKKRIAIRTSLAASLGAAALMVTAVLAQADPDGDSGTATCNAVATQGNTTISQVSFSEDLDANPNPEPEELDVSLNPNADLNVTMDCNIERGINAPEDQYMVQIFMVTNGSSSGCPAHGIAQNHTVEAGQDEFATIGMIMRMNEQLARLCETVGVSVKDATG